MRHHSAVGAARGALFVAPDSIAGFEAEVVDAVQGTVAGVAQDWDDRPERSAGSGGSIVGLGGGGGDDGQGKGEDDLRNEIVWQLSEFYRNAVRKVDFDRLANLGTKIISNLLLCSIFQTYFLLYFSSFLGNFGFSRKIFFVANIYTYYIRHTLFKRLDKSYE